MPELAGSQKSGLAELPRSRYATARSFATLGHRKMMAVAFCGLASGDAGALSTIGNARHISEPAAKKHNLSFQLPANTLLHRFPIEDDNTRRRNSRYCPDLQFRVSFERPFPAKQEK